MISELNIIENDNNVHREYLVIFKQIRSTDPGILYEARVSHTFKPYWKSLSLAVLPDGKKSLFFDFKRSIFELCFGGGTICFPGGFWALIAATSNHISLA